VVNIENAAGGFGITPEVLDEFSDLPIDCFTSGNHIWDKKAGLPLLDERSNVLRPPTTRRQPGRGLHVGETAAGIPVATINLEGQVFMSPLDSPFERRTRCSRARRKVKVFWSTSTPRPPARSRRWAGTSTAGARGGRHHTHVPTADAACCRGTAFITDVGMTGPYESIIGFPHRPGAAPLPAAHAVAVRGGQGRRATGRRVIEIDPKSGRAQSIEPLLLRVE
jgi:calcineurin-like phosphoesterase